MIQLVYDKNKYLMLPSSLADFTAQQFIHYAAVMNSNLSLQKAKILLLKILSGKSWFAYKRIPNDVKLAAMEHIDWIFEDNICPKQLLPKYRYLFGKTFYGPKSEFENICFAEFYYADIAYNNYKKEGEIQYLDQLCAILYRPAKSGYDFVLDKDGDCREQFNANTIAYYSTKTAKWPMAVKQAILMYYDSCKLQLIRDYPEIFSQTSSSDEDGDFFDVIRSLSGGKYGTFKEVEYLPLHNGLREIQCIILENERIKQQLKD